jgi:hypothetical protein
MRDGYRVVMRQYERKMRFVQNPSTSYWGILLDKLRWATPPSYNERGG